MRKTKHLKSYIELLTLLSSTGISASECQDELGISRATFGQLIDRLKRKGVRFQKEYEGVVVYYNVVNMAKVTELYYQAKLNI